MFEIAVENDTLFRLGGSLNLKQSAENSAATSSDESSTLPDLKMPLVWWKNTCNAKMRWLPSLGIHLCSPC